MTAVMYREDGERLTILRRYSSLAAAKAALTRMERNGKDVDGVKVCTKVYFDEHIDHYIEVRGHLYGNTVTIKASTPASCDPSSELYWSM